MTREKLPALDMAIKLFNDFDSDPRRVMAATSIALADAANQLNTWLAHLHEDLQSIEKQLERIEVATNALPPAAGVPKRRIPKKPP